MVVVTGDDDAQLISPLMPPRRVRVLVARREDQPGWCKRAAGRIRLRFWRLKLVRLVVAAWLPVVTGLFRSRGGGGVQCHERWIDYHPAVKAFKRERHLYQARAGPVQARAGTGCWPGGWRNW